MEQLIVKTISKYHTPRGVCNLSDCINPHFALGFCQRHYTRFRSHGDPYLTKNNIGDGHTYEERFWSKVDKTFGNGPNGTCWIWTGSKDKDGYGKSKMNGKDIRAHRRSWLYMFNSLPAKQLLHSCDNRSCVNVNHLRIGSPIENSQDMVKRKRQAFGERHGMSKLTWTLVREIRGLLSSGISGVEVARLFGLSKAHVSNIKLNRTWQENVDTKQ